MSATLPAEDTLDALDASACQVALSRLEVLPVYLDAADRAQVNSLRERLARRLDDLDFSQLLERVRRLPPSRLAELVSLLSVEAKARK